MMDRLPTAAFAVLLLIVLVACTEAASTASSSSSARQSRIHQKMIEKARHAKLVKGIDAHKDKIIAAIRKKQQETGYFKDYESDPIADQVALIETQAAQRAREPITLAVIGAVNAVSKILTWGVDMYANWRTRALKEATNKEIDQYEESICKGVKRSAAGFSEEVDKLLAQKYEVFNDQTFEQIFCPNRYYYREADHICAKMRRRISDLNKLITLICPTKEKESKTRDQTTADEALLQEITGGLKKEQEWITKQLGELTGVDVKDAEERPYRILSKARGIFSDFFTYLTPAANFIQNARLKIQQAKALYEVIKTTKPEDLKKKAIAAIKGSVKNFQDKVKATFNEKIDGFKKRVTDKFSAMKSDLEILESPTVGSLLSKAKAKMQKKEQNAAISAKKAAIQRSIEIEDIVESADFQNLRSIRQLSTPLGLPLVDNLVDAIDQVSNFPGDIERTLNSKILDLQTDAMNMLPDAMKEIQSLSEQIPFGESPGDLIMDIIKEKVQTTIAHLIDPHSLELAVGYFELITSINSMGRTIGGIADRFQLYLSDRREILDRAKIRKLDFAYTACLFTAQTAFSLAQMPIPEIVAANGVAASDTKLNFFKKIDPQCLDVMGWPAVTADSVAAYISMIPRRKEGHITSIIIEKYQNGCARPHSTEIANLEKGDEPPRLYGVDLTGSAHSTSMTICTLKNLNDVPISDIFLLPFHEVPGEEEEERGFIAECYFGPSRHKSDGDATCESRNALHDKEADGFEMVEFEYRLHHEHRRGRSYICTDEEYEFNTILLAHRNEYAAPIAELYHVSTIIPSWYNPNTGSDVEYKIEDNSRVFRYIIQRSLNSCVASLFQHEEYLVVEKDTTVFLDQVITAV